MLAFQPPPPTAYDLRFRLFGIPVRVHPLFWLMALVLGISSGDAARLALWIAIVFVSVVVHELGHALAMRLHGQASRIVLHLMGGLTIPEPPAHTGGWFRNPLKTSQEILITFAGPAAGLLLAAAVMAGVLGAGGSVALTMLFGILPWPVVELPGSGALANWMVSTAIWVNLFWSLMNLAPVYPLDGGQIARYALTHAMPAHAVRASLWISMITAAALAVLSWILLRSLFMAILFGFLAVESYQAVAQRPARRID